MTKIGIIIQARMQSTRMPGKILKDFADNKNILKIITDNILHHIKVPVYIATTTNPADIKIVDFCKSNGLNYFCGSESDVLSRFVTIADKENLTHCVRICSDNPFIYPDDISELIEICEKNPELDYISYRIAGKPSILTHFGFWTELVSLKSLKVAMNSNDSKYHEHVTNYVYSNPENFNIHFIDLNNYALHVNDIRLTVDTPVDFKIAQEIYNYCKDDLSPTKIINFVQDNEAILSNMRNQIIINTK